VEARGAGAFSVKYRLAPECFFPAAVRDGLDAYRALLAKAVSASSFILAGDEAVTLAVRNAGLEMPVGVVALSPWADFLCRGLRYWQTATKTMSWIRRRYFFARAIICANPIRATCMLSRPIAACKIFLP
jgi:acetyl esterase/lipase